MRSILDLTRPGHSIAHQIEKGNSAFEHAKSLMEVASGGGTTSTPTTDDHHPNESDGKAKNNHHRNNNNIQNIHNLEPYTAYTQAQTQYEIALQHYTTALKKSRRVYGNDSVEVAKVLHGIGLCLASRARGAGVSSTGGGPAAGTAGSAAAAGAAGGGTKRGSIATTFMNTNMAGNDGDYFAAMNSFEESLQIRQERLGPGSPEAAETTAQMIRVLDDIRIRSGVGERQLVKGSAVGGVMGLSGSIGNGSARGSVGGTSANGGGGGGDVALSIDVGTNLLEWGDYKKAERVLKECLANVMDDSNRNNGRRAMHHHNHHQQGHNDAEKLKALSAMAELDRAQGKYEEAKELYLEALKTARKMDGKHNESSRHMYHHHHQMEDSSNGSNGYHPNAHHRHSDVDMSIINSIAGYGEILRKGGDLWQAEALHKKVRNMLLAAKEKRNKVNQNKEAQNEGDNQQDHGTYHDPLQDSHHDTDMDLHLAVSHTQLGCTQYALQKYAEALMEHKSALDIRLQYLEFTDELVAESFNYFAETLCAMSQAAAAQIAAATAAARSNQNIDRRNTRRSDRSSLSSKSSHNSQHSSHSHPPISPPPPPIILPASTTPVTLAALALPLSLHAVEIRKSEFGTSHPSYAHALSVLSTCYHCIGRHHDAKPLIERCLSICEKAFDNKNHANLIGNLVVEGDIGWAIGKDVGGLSSRQSRDSGLEEEEEGNAAQAQETEEALSEGMKEIENALRAYHRAKAIHEINFKEGQKEYQLEMIKEKIDVALHDLEELQSRRSHPISGEQANGSRSRKKDDAALHELGTIKEYDSVSPESAPQSLSSRSTSNNRINHRSKIKDGGTPLIVLTDIGRDIDDALALVILSSLKRMFILDPLAVIVTLAPEEERAFLARVVLDSLGMYDVPVGVGSDGGNQGGMDLQCFHSVYAGQLRPFRVENGIDLMRRSLKEAEDHSVKLLCMASLRDLSEFIRLEQDLFLSKVQEVIIMGGAEYSERGQMLIPDKTAYNNRCDIKAAQHVYHVCQSQKIPTTTVTRYAAYGCPFTNSFLDKLHDEHHLLSKSIRNANLSAMLKLWYKVNLPPGDPMREKLPARNDRKWFMKFFNIQLEEGEGEVPSDAINEGKEKLKKLLRKNSGPVASIWQDSAHVYLYDPLAMLHCVEAYREMHFVPKCFLVEGTVHRVTGMGEVIGVDSSTKSVVDCSGVMNKENLVMEIEGLLDQGFKLALEEVFDVTKSIYNRRFSGDSLSSRDLKQGHRLSENNDGKSNKPGGKSEGEQI